jgi:predicted metal-dependent hydrolase
MYLGCRLTVLKEESSSKNVAFRLIVDRLMASMPSGCNSRLIDVLGQWYRTQASILINEKVAKWNAFLGVKHNRNTFRGQRTRWGSCFRKGSLNFNWKLLMVPEAVIDYVVIHELAHLKEMNHSDNFWKVVSGCCPAFKECRKWLRQQEDSLNSGLFACCS